MVRLALGRGMAKLQPKQITEWREGYARDVHMISSVPIPRAGAPTVPPKEGVIREPTSATTLPIARITGLRSWSVGRIVRSQATRFTNETDSAAEGKEATSPLIPGEKEPEVDQRSRKTPSLSTGDQRFESPSLHQGVRLAREFRDCRKGSAVAAAVRVPRAIPIGLKGIR